MGGNRKPKIQTFGPEFLNPGVSYVLTIVTASGVEISRTGEFVDMRLRERKLQLLFKLAGGGRASVGVVVGCGGEQIIIGVTHERMRMDAANLPGNDSLRGGRFQQPGAGRRAGCG